MCLSISRGALFSVKVLDLNLSADAPEEFQTRFLAADVNFEKDHLLVMLPIERVCITSAEHYRTLYQPGRGMVLVHKLPYRSIHLLELTFNDQLIIRSTRKNITIQVGSLMERIQLDYMLSTMFGSDTDSHYIFKSISQDAIQLFIGDRSFNDSRRLAELFGRAHSRYWQNNMRDIVREAFYEAPSKFHAQQALEQARLRTMQQVAALMRSEMLADIKNARAFIEAKAGDYYTTDRLIGQYKIVEMAKANRPLGQRIMSRFVKLLAPFGPCVSGQKN